MFASSRTRQAGFTLLELLVVLVIVALSYAIVPRLFHKGVSNAELKSAARQMATGLRKMRSEAINTQKEKTFTLDRKTHVFRLAGESKNHPLPSEADLTVTTIASEVQSKDSGAIRFFPDGSASGGHVAIKYQDMQYVVNVDWLTGRVSVMEK